MNREVVDVPPSFLQHGAVPIHVVVAYGYQFDRGIDGTHCLRITVVVSRVSLGIRVTAHPIAPDLIADFPKLHAERIQVAIRRTHRSVLRSCWSIAILDPGRGLVDGCAASLDIDGKRSLGAERARKQNEFI